MPGACPGELRARAVELVLAGKGQRQTAADLGIHPVTLSRYPSRVSSIAEIPETPTSESSELSAARRRIRELETELAVARQAAKLLGEQRPRPRGSPH